MFLFITVDDCHKLFDFLIGQCNLHPLTPQYIGGAHKHRISQPVCYRFRLLSSVHRTARRPRNLCLFQNLIKNFPILRGIHIFCFCAQNRNAHLHQTLRQLDRSLSAKLHHRAVGFLHVDNILHILRRQRLKIEFIRYVEIGTDCLRIVVDDNRFISLFCKSPCCVHGTIIKLNSLPDANRTGTEYQHLFLRMGLYNFRLGTKHGIVIGRARRKLSRAGIYHLKCRNNTVIITHFFNFFFCSARQSCNHLVREFDSLCFP